MESASILDDLDKINNFNYYMLQSAIKREVLEIKTIYCERLRFLSSRVQIRFLVIFLYLN